MCILTISRCKDQEFSNEGTVENGHPNTHFLDNKKGFGNVEKLFYKRNLSEKLKKKCREYPINPTDKNIQCEGTEYLDLNSEYINI